VNEVDHWDEIMGVICHEYKMTPDQFMALTLPQFRAFSDHLAKRSKGASDDYST